MAGEEGGTTIEQLLEGRDSVTSENSLLKQRIAELEAEKARTEVDDGFREAAHRMVDRLFTERTSRSDLWFALLTAYVRIHDLGWDGGLSQPEDRIGAVANLLRSGWGKEGGNG